MGFGYTEKDAKNFIRNQYILFGFFIIGLFSTLNNMISYRQSLLSLVTWGAIFVGILFGTTTYLIHRDRVVPYIKCKTVLFLSKGNIKEAEEMIDKKIETNFMRFKIHWKDIKAMILIKKGELDTAETILEELEKNYPDFKSMLYTRACLESIRGNHGKSLKYLIKSLKVLEKIKKSCKDPYSKLFARHWTPHFISYVKEDEDLKGVRETDEFWNFVKTIERTR